MSTRCVINFVEGTQHAAKIYRHCDGYPDGEHGVPASLQQFFADVKKQATDTRFGDASYLAAKFVVWQADQNAGDSDKPLDFISLGIITSDPGDIEFVYTVDCGRMTDGKPTVDHRHA
ncbi:MAG: hypothetical protein V3T11_10045 [Roseateles sp.]